MNLSTRQKQTHRYRADFYLVGGSRGGKGMDWEFGVSRCKLLHLEWINNKVLIYSTGNYIQSPGRNHNGKQYKKMYMNFPGGLVVESLPASARDMYLNPDTGRFHMPRDNQARVLQLLSLFSATREGTTMRNPCTTKNNPHLPQLEKAHVQPRRHSAAKNEIILKCVYMSDWITSLCSWR